MPSSRYHYTLQYISLYHRVDITYHTVDIIISYSGYSHTIQQVSLYDTVDIIIRCSIYHYTIQQISAYHKQISLYHTIDITIPYSRYPHTLSKYHYIIQQISLYDKQISLSHKFISLYHTVDIIIPYSRYPCTIQQLSLYHTSLTCSSVLQFHLRRARKVRYSSGIQPKILCTFIFFPHIMLLQPILFRMVRYLFVLHRALI